MNAGLVASCHDCSEGGVAIAVAEMALAAELGAVLELDSIPGCDAEDLLFSESSGRYVVEVAKGSGAAFEACFEDLHLFKIGAVQEQRQLLLKNQGQDQQLSVEACRNAWLGQ
jgi:phosphoribosylformylglycinamidine synthase